MKTDDVAIDLTLLKLCGFYKMFDPTVTKIYNWNVYLLSLIVISLIDQLIFIFGNLGFFIEMEDSYCSYDFFLHAFSGIEIYLFVLKVWVLFYNSDQIWELFDITKLNLLTIKLCNKNILYKNHNTNIKIINLYFIGAIMMIAPWIIFPFFTNKFTTNNDDIRFKNIINLRFPVTISTYNQYFLIFYIIEFFNFTSVTYLMVITEIFFITFCSTLIGHYKLLENATQNIGHENEHQMGRNILTIILRIIIIL